jgi:hypothetical protein
MKTIVSAIGFTLFAGAALLHFWSFFQIAVLLQPKLGILAAPPLIALWLGALGMLLHGMRVNRLKRPFAILFGYVMFIMFAGTQALIGVPSPVGDGNWRDPHGLLTPEAKFILHNHGNVTKVVSEKDFTLYTLYGQCYFTAGFMMLSAAMYLAPIDRDNQIGFDKRRR